MKSIRKIGVSSFILLLSTVIVRIFTFAAGILGARLLSQEMYGVYSTIRGGVGLIEAAFSSSAGNILIARAKSGSSSLLGYYFVTSVALLIAFSVLSIFLVLLFSFSIGFEASVRNEVLGYLPEFLLFLVSSLVFSLVQKIYIANSELISYLKFSIVSVLIFLPLLYYLTLERGFHGLLISLVLFHTFDSLVKLCFCKNLELSLIAKYKFKKILNGLKKIILHVKYLLAIVLMIQGVSYLLRINMLNYSGSLKAMAIWEVTSNVLTIMLLITGSVTSICLQFMAKVDRNHWRLIGSVLRTSLLLNFLISFAFGIGLLLWSEKVMSLFGRQYVEYSDYLYYALILSVFISVQATTNKYHIIRRSTSGSFIIILFSSVLIGIISFLVPIDGVELLYKYLIGFYALIIFLEVLAVYFYKVRNLLSERK